MTRDLMTRLHDADPAGDHDVPDARLVAAVTARVDAANSASDGPRRRPRWKPATVGLAAVALIGGGVAVATNIPEEVIGSMSPDLTPGTEAARVCEVADPSNDIELVATAPWGDGGTVQLFVAPTTSGDLFITLTQTNADGSPHGGSSGCGEMNAQEWAAATGDLPDASPDAGYAIVYGRTTSAPGPALVRYSTGAEVEVTVDDDGYFIEVVDGDPRPITDADGSPTVTPAG